MAFKIDTSFIGKFKTGDNITYNAGIICDLYDAAKRIGGACLYKPKIVFNVSLIDAAFYDFIYRIQKQAIEFTYLDADTREKIRQLDRSKLNTFKSHINKFRHYNLLGKNQELYDEINELNTLRNRIHIQNEKGVFHKDDADAFTEEKLVQSERCTEFVLKFLSLNYPRIPKCVKDIELPWADHFDDKMKWPGKRASVEPCRLRGQQ